MGARETIVRTLKLTLAYDGSRFVGWQRQADGESIQGVLERALDVLNGEPVTLHGAGRTDAGVHAFGQVASVAVSVPHDVETIVRALNAHLPRDIRVLAVDDVPVDFHARFSARGKMYRYLVRNAPLLSPFERGYVWHITERLHLDRMQRAAMLLCGTHDFAVFQSSGSRPGSTTRTITRSEVVVARAARSFDPPAPGVLLSYEVEGDGFLRHMVRAIVGTLVEIGQGRREPADMAELLAAGTRAQAGITAPAHGLYLVRVDYD